MIATIVAFYNVLIVRDLQFRVVYAERRDAKIVFLLKKQSVDLLFEKCSKTSGITFATFCTIFFEFLDLQLVVLKI